MIFVKTWLKWGAHKLDTEEIYSEGGATKRIILVKLSVLVKVYTNVVVIKMLQSRVLVWCCMKVFTSKFFLAQSVFVGHEMIGWWIENLRSVFHPIFLFYSLIWRMWFLINNGTGLDVGCLHFCHEQKSLQTG